MTRDEALSTSVSVAINVTQDGEVVSFDRSAFKKNLAKAGFALVPLEPTEKMKQAGGVRRATIQIGASAMAGEIGHWSAHDVYRAMVAAYEKDQGDG